MATRQHAASRLRSTLSKPYAVVGIVDGTKNFSIGEDPQPQLYEDLARIDNGSTRVQFVVRSATPPVTQLQAVHAALLRVEPNAGLEVAAALLQYRAGVSAQPGGCGLARTHGACSA